jgi:hypothetical protein
MADQPGPDSLRAGFRPHDWDEASKYAEVAWLYDNVVRPHADQWQAERKDNADLRWAVALAEALVLSHEGHIERLEADWRMDLKAENADLKADNAALREALRWMVNVANGVGKSGGEPWSDEWKDATDAGMAALASHTTDGTTADLCDTDLITDDCGNYWHPFCPTCGGRMQVVRPGKVQCSECIASLEADNAALREQADVDRSFIEQYQREVAALRERLKEAGEAMWQALSDFEWIEMQSRSNFQASILLLRERIASLPTEVTP